MTSDCIGGRRWLLWRLGLLSRAHSHGHQRLGLSSDHLIDSILLWRHNQEDLMSLRPLRPYVVFGGHKKSLIKRYFFPWLPGAKHEICFYVR